jgi:hypothetical protein
MPPVKLLITSFLFMLYLGAKAQEIWTIGPMLNVNFGGEKRSFSFAIEAAYWNISSFPHSIDFGIEFDRRKTRLYSEFQTGIGVAGISAGPVFQFGKDGGAKLGLQTTAWINYYLGLDLRMRFLKDEKIKSIGTYLKLPFATSGLDTDDDSDWGGDFDGWD